MIKCAACEARHADVATVRACHEGRVFPCQWAVERPGHWVQFDEDGDGQYIEGGIVDCAADAVATDRGWTCAAGHEHVTAEARHAERWDYAEEYGEAMAMAMAVVEPITTDGHVVTGPHDFERV